MARTEIRRKSKAGAPLPEIPDKLYFRIGEVGRLLNLPSYVLRFWESEFPHLKPNKGGTGQRLYRRRDVEAALEIRRLLYDEGYTIPGARQFLKDRLRAPEPELELVPDAREAAGSAAKLRRLRAGLRDIASLLDRPSPAPRRLNPAHRGLHIPPRLRTAPESPPPLFPVPHDPEGDPPS